MVLQKQGEGAAVGGALRGAQPPGHLPLDEHRDRFEAGSLNELRQYRRRDVVGQVGADDGAEAVEPFPYQGVQIQLHHVSRHDLHIGVGSHSLGQHRQQGLVQLHGYHLACPLCQFRCQWSDTRADLQHAAASVGPGRGGNVVRHLRVDEEILPHGFGKMETVPPKQLPDIVVVAEKHLLSTH